MVHKDPRARSQFIRARITLFIYRNSALLKRVEGYLYSGAILLAACWLLYGWNDLEAATVLLGASGGLLTVLKSVLAPPTQTMALLDLQALVAVSNPGAGGDWVPIYAYREADIGFKWDTSLRASLYDDDRRGELRSYVNVTYQGQPMFSTRIVSPSGTEAKFFGNKAEPYEGTTHITRLQHVLSWMMVIGYTKEDIDRLLKHLGVHVVESAETSWHVPPPKNDAGASDQGAQGALPA